MEQWNPYSTTPTPVNPYEVDPTIGFLSPQDAKKAEAVIKEANQFWVAILFLFICSVLGIVSVGPWYAVRYLQWKSLAKKYPSLLAPNAPHSSLADRFRRSQWKLLSCIIVGLVVLSLLVLFVVASVVLLKIS